MKRLLLAAAFALAPAVAAAQGAPPLAPVRSVDIADTDWSDLAPLGKAIGRRRIVLLGETAHGDGTTFAAKARIVRYLHDVLGFDVLVFESGLFSMDMAQRAITAGTPPSAAVPKGLFPLWGEADQVQPLLRWLDASRSGRRGAMAVAGVDVQPTGAYGADWPAWLRETGGHVGASSVFDRLAEAVERTRARKETPSVGVALAMACSAVAQAGGRERAWRMQMLDNVADYLEFMPAMLAGKMEMGNMRDARMAANLAYLRRGPYRGRRIVVWGATSHLLRQREGFGGDGAAGMVPMGEHIARERPRDVYVLAVTSGGGAVGSWIKRTATPLPAPPADTLEAQLARSGTAYGFAPLPRDWTGRSWMLGYSPMAGPWGASVDGVFFVADQRPATYPPRPAAR